MLDSETRQIVEEMAASVGWKLRGSFVVAPRVAYQPERCYPISKFLEFCENGLLQNAQEKEEEE